MTYDLERRTLEFSRAILKLLRNIKRSDLNKNIINQLIRSSTSIGANYCEANGASSKKDFRNKIHLCKKEAQETRYWLTLLAETNQLKIEILRELWREANELSKIFGSITGSMKKKLKI